MLRSDFNVTALHLKDMVNRTPQIKNPPGRQVSAMGRGEGRGRGTDRGGRDGRGQCHGCVLPLCPYQRLDGQGDSLVVASDSPCPLRVPRYMAARSLVWTVIKGCIGNNNKPNLQLKQFNNTTDGHSAYFAI